MTSVRILGVDPGFANIGLCLVELTDDGKSELLDTKLIITSPSEGKVGVIDDEIRRLSEIEQEFLLFLTLNNPQVIAIEEPGKCLMKRYNSKTRKVEWASNPARLRTACQMWGSIHGIATAKGIDCVKIGSQEIKKHLCNNKNASKAEIIKTVKSNYPNYSKWPTTKKIEHVADSIGAAIVSFTKDIVLARLKQ